MHDFDLLSRIIRSRRSIFPEVYTEEKVPDDRIRQILENANWAPTHRKTEPWRFQVFTGDALGELADYLSSYYRDHTPEAEFSDVRFRKTRNKPLRSSHVIAICMKRDPGESVPEWEEVAAVSCAVMNIWLSCTALGLGCYWSTPKAILEAEGFLGVGEGEKCLGLFYIGVPRAGLDPVSERRPAAEKIRWKR